MLRYICALVLLCRAVLLARLFELAQNFNAIHCDVTMTLNIGITILPDLKHKDSFGKSENLSKIFFTEIQVFDHDYEGKSSSSNGLL